MVKFRRRVWLPDGFYVWKFLDCFVFCNEGQGKIQCCRDDYFVMKLGNISHVYHLTKDWVIKRDQHKIIAFIYIFEQFLEVKKDAFLFKYTESFCDDDGWDKNYVFSIFATLEDFS
jgi:hypothetical protein